MKKLLRSLLGRAMAWLDEKELEPEEPRVYVLMNKDGDFCKATGDGSVTRIPTPNLWEAAWAEKEFSLWGLQSNEWRAFPVSPDRVTGPHVPDGSRHFPPVGA